MEKSSNTVYDDASTLVSFGRSTSGQTRSEEPEFVPMQDLSDNFHSVHTVRLPPPAFSQRALARSQTLQEQSVPPVDRDPPERRYSVDDKDKAPSSFSKFITFDWEGNENYGGARRESRRRSYNSNRVSVDHFDPSGVEEISRRLSVQSSKRNSGIIQDVASGKGFLGDNVIDIVDPAAAKSFSFEAIIRDVLERGQAEHIPVRSIGVLFKDLKVTVHAPTSALRPTLGSIVNPSYLLQLFRDVRHPKTRDILSGFSGVVSPGEMLLVLGRPGSGCSTLLKTLANQTEEYLTVAGERHYDSLSPEDMSKRFRGDLAYCPEDDVHFPTLTVQETVSFAAKTRMPNLRLQGQTRQQYAAELTELLLTVFGLRHTKKTKVGDAELRGVSGGEKKRVSISEALAARCLLGCWDNSTRGLDSSTALEFGRALRIATDLAQMTTIVSIYQAGENLYELFDKVCVVGEGKMYYYGRADKARAYFEGLGYLPANRQTTADFLVSVTDPSSRIPNPRHPSPLPRTSEEFARAFRVSRNGKENDEDMMAYWHEFVGRGDLSKLYAASVQAEHSKWTPEGSPYTTSLFRQLSVVSLRRWQIVRGNLTAYVIQCFATIIQAIVVGTIFLKTPNNTSSFFSRGGVMYFAIAFGSIDSMSEIPSLFSQRRILHRHKKAAMYHPFMDALAYTIVDILPTLIFRILFGTILYFLVGLQHTAEQFFTFYLIIVITTLTMKAMFRGIAASTRQLSTAQAMAGFVTTTLITYAGYTIPKPSIPGGARWLTQVNPLALAFESILVNEVHTLDPPCSSLVPQGPGYENVSLVNQVCTTVGSVSGQLNVNGNRFLEQQYSYSFSHLWRNIGIVVALWGAFLSLYLFFTEINTTSSTDFSRVLFKVGARSKEHGADAEEEKSFVQDIQTTYGRRIRPSMKKSAATTKPQSPPQGDVFSWRNVRYSVSTSDGQRVLLDNVAGYVAPGRLTALMGESGAGKTTLLNVLAGRQGVGIVNGEILVNGRDLPVDFKSQTAYCQQTDTHTDEQTVREALLFSAKLRQPATVPLSEKEAYVETCLKTCGLEDYADAIVGTLGVEHKKRTTIGVELAAKPRLLLFLDEPTSGLDSQSSLAIMKFLRALADGGQAILCTIHQPSGELFEYFDRLLLLRKGGKTVYFGDLGKNCKIMTAYFEGKGARACGDAENPAEWMLEVIGTGSTSTVTQDWHDTWLNSYEAAQLEDHLVQLHSGYVIGNNSTPVDTAERTAFATSWSYQFKQLLGRTFLSYWRNPVYVMSIVAVNFFCGLLVGLSFKNTPDTIQGTENKLFAVFMAVIVGIPVGNQLQVMFVNLRRVFEVRERASQMYHWTALLTAQFIVDYFCNVLGALVEFNSWFWLIGFPSGRAPYTLLMLTFVYPLYFTSLAQMCAAMSSTAQGANALYALLFSFAMSFSGVLQPFQALGWWKWMNRISSIGYIIEGILGQAVGHQLVECAQKEFSIVQPPSGLSCQGYMNEYIQNFGGYLNNPNAKSSCEFCSIRTTDQYIANNFNIFYSHRWRDVGIVVGVSIFNLVMMYNVAYLFRIRQGSLFKFPWRKGSK